MRGRSVYVWGGHRLVRGWVEPQALRLVAALSAEQHRQGVHGGVAEIGVHHGRLFLAMHLLKASGEESVAVDLFDDQANNVDQSGAGNLEIFKRNLDRHAPGIAHPTIIARDSLSLTSDDLIAHAHGEIRMFSVDGGHTAGIVESDMSVAADSLTRGGIIIGDDYFNPQWPGVSQGTLRFLERNREIRPFAIAFNKVFFTRPEWVERYADIVWQNARRFRWAAKSSDLADSPVVVAWKPTPFGRAKVAAKLAMASR